MAVPDLILSAADLHKGADLVCQIIVEAGEGLIGADRHRKAHARIVGAVAAGGDAVARGCRALVEGA